MKRKYFVITILLLILSPKLFSQVTNGVVYDLLNETIKLYTSKERLGTDESEYTVSGYLDINVQRTNRVIERRVAISNTLINAKVMSVNEAFDIIGDVQTVVDSVKYESLKAQYDGEYPANWDCASMQGVLCVSNDSLEVLLYETKMPSIIRVIDGENYIYPAKPNFRNLGFMLSYPLFFGYENMLYAIVPMALYFDNATLGNRDMFRLELFRREGPIWKHLYSEMGRYRIFDEE